MKVNLLESCSCAALCPCVLGPAKPDQEFFRRVVRRIGVPAAEVLFVDDSEANVEGARAAGLVAEHWHFERGPESLLALLAAHGIRLDTP